MLESLRPQKSVQSAENTRLREGLRFGAAGTAAFATLGEGCYRFGVLWRG